MGKIPWRKKWQPTPVFVPGEFHGQRILAATAHGVTNSWTERLILSLSLGSQSWVGRTAAPGRGGRRMSGNVLVLRDGALEGQGLRCRKGPWGGTCARVGHPWDHKVRPQGPHCFVEWPWTSHYTPCISGATLVNWTQEKPPYCPGWM